MTREAVRAHQRARVLDAAMGLLAEGGYATMTLDAVAVRARVSKRDLYLVAGTRRSLQGDAYLHALEPILRAAREACGPGGGASLQTVFGAVLEALDARPIHAELLLAEAADVDSAQHARATTTVAFADLLRRHWPWSLSDLHAQVVCGGLRFELQRRWRSEASMASDARNAAELGALCAAMLGVYDPVGGVRCGAAPQSSAEG